jgi:flagellar protein FlaI
MADNRLPQKPFSYMVEREEEGRSLVMNCKGTFFYPSIEDSEIYMEKIINAIIEAGSVSTITLSAERNYVYPEEQVKLLNEIAKYYVFLMREKKVVSVEKLAIDRKLLPKRIAVLNNIMDMFKKDPIGAYVATLREIRKQRVRIEKATMDQKAGFQSYISQLNEILNTLENTEMINAVRKNLAGHKVGDRSIYREVFEPLIRPNFMFTRLMSEPPIRGEEIDSYSIGQEDKSDVTIYRVPNKIQYLYHVIPPEFQLSEEEQLLLNEAEQILGKYKPNEKGFIDPKRMRDVFFNISRDLIDELALARKLELSFVEIKQLAKILVRLTVGIGMIEVLLADEKVEDIYMNAPVGTTPIFLKHSEYGECTTNIIPNFRDADAWATRFRLISGRPLDEANPVLDTELITPETRARVAIIQRPLSPHGLSFAFRRHRPRPWTLPLFIKQGMISPLGAGLLSFIVDGSRTMLVAGTRGAGKSSLLGSLMVEVMRKFRMISIEDTMELPVSYLRGMGYDIIPMKVRSAIVGSKSEMSAAEGIRTSLRLGDSCLFIGEVRSTEAVALYEAMRIGALANVVAGTIHGESSYGVFDRVVNDLGVPKTSFKATDLVIICNKLRSPDMLSEFRRVVEITEVRKHWTDDPMREHGFLNLMEYNAKKDLLEPTKDLMEGETEVIKSIASKVKDWVGDWDKVWENILLRTKIKSMLVDYSEKTRSNSVIEADFVVDANDQYHRIFDKLREETGYPNTKDVLSDFESWLKMRLRGKETQNGSGDVGGEG